MLTTKRIAIGKIIDAHGIKGLVKILPFDEDPMLIEELSPLFTGETGNDTLSITMKNSAGKYWLAQVDGATDRNAAEALRGTLLYIDHGALPEIEDGAFYFEDLKGLEAFDEQGTKIGSVLKVENYGAGDLLEIKPLNGNSYYLPFKQGEQVLSVNLKERKIIINPQGFADV